MSAIKAMRQRTIFENNENGFGIYVCRTDTKMYITVKGYDIPAAGSCWINMTGKWVEDPKRGRQFEVQSCEVEKPTSREGVIDYFGSLKIGMGKARASAVYTRFGENVWNVLDNEPERIREVAAVPSAVIDKFLEVSAETSATRDLMRIFEGSPEFTAKQASKIAKKLKGKAVDIIEKNPYALCSLPDLGFKAVDRLASRMEGIGNTFPPRLSNAVYYTLRKQEISGHTCMPEDELERETLALLNSQSWHPVSLHELKSHLGQMITEKKIYKTNGMFFRRSRYHEERLLAEGIVRLMRSPVTNARYAQFSLNNFLEQYMQENGIRFAPDQKTAIINAFLNPVSIVTGGPGTGKTTLTKAILALDKVISGNKSNPLLLAPTGRAAKRLSEATGHNAQTVHSAIRYFGEKAAPEGLAPQSKGLFSEASLIIVDEASMLDQMIASWMIQIIPSGTRLVFVGDSDQLPSVGAGNVLHEMIVSNVVPVTRLNVIFRQNGVSPIVANAAKIHEGKHDLTYNRDFKSFDIDSEAGQVYKAVEFYVKCFNYYGADNVMMLCPYRNSKFTKVNTSELNRQIQHQVNPVKEGELSMSSRRNIFHANDRVIQLKNVDCVLNGDVGIVTEVIDTIDENDSSKVSRKLTVDFGMGIMREYTEDMLNELDLAYCNTVHKSQGSEYPVVILVLSNKHQALLQRNLVYTAITRATKNVALIGDINGINSALGKAIDNTKSGERHTTLSKRLSDCWASTQMLNKKIG